VTLNDLRVRLEVGHCKVVLGVKNGIPKTVEDKAQVTINCLYKVTHMVCRLVCRLVPKCMTYNLNPRSCLRPSIKFNHWAIPFLDRIRCTL